MNIGEQIISAISNGPLFKIADNTRNAWIDDCVVVWMQSAAEQLDALVAAHVEEQVRIRLELDRQDLQERLEKSTYFIRKDGKLVFLAIKKREDGKEYVDMDDEVLIISHPNPH